MADMQTLLDLAGKGQNLGVNPNGSMIDRIAPQPLKQQSVANAASTKQAELSQKVEQPIDYYKVAAGAGTDVGLLGQKGPEYDLRTMTPAELQEKYGYATTIDMLANKLTAKQNYRNDQEAPRSGMEMLTDTALAVESGVMGGIGGLSSWALSGVAPEASVAIAEGTNRATDFLNDFTSDTAKGALRASETRSGLSYADNEYMRQAESEAGASDTVASLRKFGRDTVDAAESLGNSDTAFAQGTSQAVGSFVSGGPLAKALRAGGALVVGGEKSLNLAKTLGALDKANGVTSTARGINAVNKVGDFLTWPAVTAALEGGGAYTGVVNEINNLSYAELAKTSPVYQAKLAELLKSKKYSLSDAQAMAKEFAVVDTAQTAAMRQAPIAAALGMVTKYGEKPFKAPSVRDGLKNVLVKEPLEESTQGLTGQLNQNLAIQQNIDKETDLSKGVGRQFVEGAAYGLSAAGVSQAPSIATLGAINTGISAYNATRGLLAKSGSIGNLILDKADAYLAAREKDSPIAEETLAEMSTVAASGGIDQIESAVNAAIDASSSSTEEKVKTKEYMASLVKAFKLDPKELEAFPDNLKADIDPANGRVVAVQQLARKVQTLTGPEQLEAAASMYALMDTMHGVQYSDPEALSSLSEDDPTRQELSHYEQVITNILNTPSIKTALLKLAEQGKAVEEAAPQIIENNAIQSPEAQAILQSTLAIASVSPEHGNVETINNLLKHSDEKRLNLTAEQRATLSNSIELIKARQAIERGISAGGLSRLQDVVSEQVIGSNDGARKGQWPSLVQHTKQIIDAMHSKNKDLATERIAELGLFLQHMENKVKAANKHFEERNSDKPPKYVPYQVLMPITREWGSSENNPKANHKGMFVNTKSEASFDLVQSAALERDIVAGVFNNFTKAFPTLGIKAIKPTPLNPELVGVPSELVKKFNPNVVKPTGGSLVDKLNASLQPTTPVVASPVVPTDTKTLTPLEQAVELGIDQIAKKIYEDGGTIFDIITKLGDKLSEESFPTEKAKIKFLGDVLEAMGAVAPYTAPINTLSKEYAEFAERAINWLNKNKDKLSEKGIQTLADLQNNPTNEEVSNIRKDFKNADMLQAVTETPADVASEEVTPTVVVKKVTKKAKVNPPAPAVEAAVSTEDTYTRESLKKLSVDELKAIATTLGLEFKPKVTANRLIKDILVEQAKLEKEEEAFDALIDAAPSLQTFQRGDPDLTEEQRKQLAVVYQIRYETAMENPIAWEIPQNDSVIEIKETTSSQYGPRTTINARSAGVTIAVAIDYTSSGELLTASAANNKYIAIPYDGMDIPTAAEAIIKKLVQQDSTTLNVAGNSIFTFNSHNPKNPITQKEINQYIFSVIKLVHETIPLTKIVSGGQTGADIAGAIAAAALGIPAVITFPKGFRQRNSYMGKDGKYAYKDVYRQSREDIREQIIDGATELVEPPFIDLTTVLENAKFAKGQRDSVVLEGSAENTGALSEAEILEGRTSQVKIAVLRNTVKGKYSIKSLYPNLVTHVPNMMIDTFGLPKGEQEPNRIFGSEAPISIVTDALATVGGLDTLVGKELNQSLTPELIAAYDSLLTVHPDAVAIMDKAILSPEDKQLNTAVTKLTYKAKKTPQEQAQLLSLKAQQQLIKDKRTLNPDDVLKVLNIGGLMAAMQVNLNNYLNQPFNPKWPDTILSFFKDNKRQLNRTNEGKVLNLVVANGDTYTYDQGLLESAALAAMQWLITASSYESIMDDAAIESYTGVSSEELSGNKAIAIQEGLSLTVAKNSLTTKIKKYWGFTSDNDADLAYQDGIAEAMASEILRGFIDIRLVAVNRIRLDQADGMRTPKDIDRFIITDFGDTLAGFPTAIDSAVLIEKDDVFFLDGDIPPVAKTQMNNPDVANSTDQLLAIEGENNTPYTMNVPVFNFFVAIGESGFRDAFGEGDTENRAMNVNDRMSAESVNKAASKMYKHMLNMATQLDNIANTTGKGIADVEIRYGHNSSSVNRLQQLGAYTPQSNKGIRELFLPTKSNLDLSGKNTIHTLAFHLGVAQALGIKVQKGTQEEAYTAVRELLSGPLAPALTLVQDWVNENDLSKSAMDKVPTSFDVSKLITAFKEANTELSVVGVHALIEFARLQNIKDKSNFTTQLYVEADGVTNGPINAMMLMTTGEFTEGFLEAVSRGGISFGEARPMSMMPKVDMYETSTINTLPALTSRIGLFNGMKGGKALVKNVEAVLRLLNLTMADISYAPNLENNGTGTLTLKRGAAKNPLTITIYGSSAAGIASKIVGILIKEVYASMSEAAQREARAKEEGIILSKAEAYFPNDKNADAKFRELTMTLGMLSSSEIVFNKRDKTYFLKDLPIAVTPIDSFEKFTFSYAEIKAIKANLLYAYVEPMVQGIEETVGKELIETTVLLRTGVQAQSVIYAAMYKQAIDDVIAERLVNDPTFKKGDFLSKNDLAAINQKLKKFAPLLESDMHNFLVTKSKELETESHSYSRALNGTMRTAPNLHIPADAGVAAVAYLTIGMGDGAMMVLLAKDGSVTGTLKVFDGMNMPLDKLHDYSLKANEAVYESYKGNPLREAGKSLSLFLEQKDEIRDFLVDEKKRIDADSLKNNNPDSSSIPSTTNLVHSVIERYTEEDSDLPIIEQVLDGLFTILYEMTGAAKSIDARHKAMRELSMAVDQMASVGSAYSNGVTGITSETPRSVVVEKLNERYKHHMAMPFDLFSEPENNNEEDAQEEVAPITATAITDISVPTKSGARLLNWNNVKNLAKSLGLTPEQKAIYDQITRTFGKSEYKVISGTFAEIAQYQKDNNLKGIDPSEASTTYGYISVGDQTIYLINPTAETLVHELIHAATYNIVLAHYMGKPNNPEATAAILDMEKLMSEFMAVSPDSLSNGKERQAFESAQATIENYQNQFSQEGDAAALNEFMAWSLANSEIASRLKSSKTQQDLRTVKNGKIRTLAKDAVKKIKEMIWGKKRAIPVGMDMLSNIQFNTAILVHLQQDMGSMVQSALLQHAVKGSSDRLTQVRIAMQQKVGMHIKAANTSALTAQSPEIMNALIQATNHALDVAAEFPMTPSEQSTFVSYVYAMATQAQIDPSIMVKAQELYSHVGKTLQVSDFMPENPQDRDAAYYEATQKFNIIMGKTFRKYDATGRSSILPTFIALATVNEDFRKILGNMKTPKYIKDTSKTMDGVLDNFGNYAMDQLSGYLSGTTNSVNVQQAIDALNFKLYENAIEEQSYLETIGDQIGGKVDTVNDIIVGKMAEAAEYGFNLGNKLTSTNTLAGKASGALVKMVSALISEQKGDVVAQSVISLINKGKINKTIHELVNEMIGRTEDNASIYDLNKIIKSTVHQIRQQFREEVPQIIADKFSRTLKAKEWTALYRGLGKTDIAVLLGSMDIKSLVNLLSNQSALDLYIKDLEQLISAKDMANWPTHQKKMMQLANYMNTKNPGNFLLRNAEAIAYLAGMPKLGSWRSPTQDTIGEMDNLISLYAFISLKKGDKDSLVSLLKSETKGIEYSLNYLKGQRDGELSKVQSGKARMNHYKGDMPSTPQQGMSLIVAKDSDFTSLTTRGYSRIGSYTGSTLDPRKVSYGYYFSPFPAKMAFSQGMMQNIKHTISGVDDTYGFSTDMVAGRITEPALVKAITKRILKDPSLVEQFMPIFDDAKNVFAYERSFDPKMMAKLNKSEHLAKMIAIWRGRQVEEKMSQTLNEGLITKLHEKYQSDTKASIDKKAEYVNLLDPESLDVIERDAVSLFSDTTLNFIKNTYGEEEFWVRKDMLKDVIGFRNASLTDPLTGSALMTKETQDTIRRVLIGFFGVDIYNKILHTEQFLQNAFSEVRTNIVVKSVIVPVANMISNIYQLISRGVPLKTIARQMPKKLLEIEYYTKSRLRQVELEADLRAIGDDMIKGRRISAELRTITDSFSRLSIWPLIQAGEFSTVADVGNTADDLELSSGKYSQWFEKQLEKAPDGVRTMARYGYVARDTSLFQGLQKAVQYGDFIAKAVLYDDLTERKKLTSAEALGRITDEFINYDRLAGRTRAAYENMGMTWFLNYKIRIAKIALSTLRNNPLHALIAGAAPMPMGIGTPIMDNIFSKAMEDTLGHSLGPSMALHAASLNPWVNLTD